MRLRTDIARTHQLVSESHHSTRNGFFPRSPLLPLRTSINLDRTAGCTKSRF
jgi:hypothetical protein